METINKNIYWLSCFIVLLIFICSGNIKAQTILFTEEFEDTDFTSRDWYDSQTAAITTAEHIEGSNACFECRFLKGGTKCSGGTPARHLFQETDEVYISYWVKYSENYTGSNKPYHPHEFQIVTNENHIYIGPAYTHLTLYIEQVEGEPLLAIQDGENIDETKIGVDLSNVTEDRAVAGCNGDSDGYGVGDCYLNGNSHYNGKQWRTGDTYFSDTPGEYYKNDWHFIEAYFKLNSIADGKAVRDGHIKYWYDGKPLIDHEDVVFRTGTHPGMKFNQFLILPYIGDGSPVEQIMWVDNLTVATSRIESGLNDFQNRVSSNKGFLKIEPNPVSGIATIKYFKTSSFAGLRFFDNYGRVVWAEDRTPRTDGIGEMSLNSVGWNSLKFAPDGLPNGIYFVVLHTGTEVQIEKMFILK